MKREERRKVGFWKPFNEWWRALYIELDRRPRAHEVALWYEQNADATWGDDKPSWVDAREHAKCLRSREEVRTYFKSFRAKKRDELMETGSPPVSNSSSPRASKEKTPRPSKFARPAKGACPGGSGGSFSDLGAMEDEEAGTPGRTQMRSPPAHVSGVPVICVPPMYHATAHVSSMHIPGNGEGNGPLFGNSQAPKLRALPPLPPVLAGNKLQPMAPHGLPLPGMPMFTGQQPVSQQQQNLPQQQQQQLVQAHESGGGEGGASQRRRSVTNSLTAAIWGGINMTGFPSFFSGGQHHRTSGRSRGSSGGPMSGILNMGSFLSQLDDHAIDYSGAQLYEPQLQQQQQQQIDLQQAIGAEERVGEKRLRRESSSVQAALSQGGRPRKLSSAMQALIWASRHQLGLNSPTGPSGQGQVGSTDSNCAYTAVSAGNRAFLSAGVGAAIGFNNNNNNNNNGMVSHTPAADCTIGNGGPSKRCWGPANGQPSNGSGAVGTPLNPCTITTGNMPLPWIPTAEHSVDLHFSDSQLADLLHECTTPFLDASTAAFIAAGGALACEDMAASAASGNFPAGVYNPHTGFTGNFAAHTHADVNDGVKAAADVNTGQTFGGGAYGSLDVLGGSGLLPRLSARFSSLFAMFKSS